jgi:hypothetical protein
LAAIHGLDHVFMEIEMLLPDLVDFIGYSGCNDQSFSIEPSIEATDEKRLFRC